MCQLLLNVPPTPVQVQVQQTTGGGNDLEALLAEENPVGESRAALLSELNKGQSNLNKKKREVKSPADIEARAAKAQAERERRQFLAAWSDVEKILTKRSDLRKRGGEKDFNLDRELRATLYKIEVLQERMNNALAGKPNYSSALKKMLAKNPEAKVILSQSTKEFNNKDTFLALKETLGPK